MGRQSFFHWLKLKGIMLRRWVMLFTHRKNQVEAMKNTEDRQREGETRRELNSLFCASGVQSHISALLMVQLLT